MIASTIRMGSMLRRLATRESGLIARPTGDPRTAEPAAPNGTHPCFEEEALLDAAECHELIDVFKSLDRS